MTKGNHKPNDAYYIDGASDVDPTRWLTAPGPVTLSDLLGLAKGHDEDMFKLNTSVDQWELRTDQRVGKG